MGRYGARRKRAALDAAERHEAGARGSGHDKTLKTTFCRLISLQVDSSGLANLHRLGSLDGVLIGTEEAVAPGEVLAVVVLKVAVMDVVVASAVDELPIGEGDAVVDGGGPDGDGNEEDEMGELVHGHDEGHDPVGPRLRPGIQGVESEGSEGAGEDEGVVQLVDGAVQELRVEGVVNPVNEEVGHDEENDHREGPVQDGERDVVEVVELEVHLGVALLQSQVDGRVDEGDNENRDQGDQELTLDLAYT